MKRVMDVHSMLDAKIEALIKFKGYRDFQHFVTTALENQVVWETAENGASTGKDKLVTINTDLLKLNSSQPAIMDPPLQSELTGKILWGQYYRFLPCKIGVRVLLNLYTKDFPDKEDFIDSVTSVALQLRPKLEKLDKMDRRTFGELLSASFPQTDKDGRSVKRFADQYMVYLRTSDMRLSGMLAALKFVNIKMSEDGRNKIGLTNFGLQFANIQNPVIDLNKPEPLSPKEIEFLLNHIANNLPDELKHILIALQAIKKGIRTRDALNDIFQNYYSQNHKGAEWSEALVNTMRSGLLSRLNELGLIKREKRGKNVRYTITADGLKYLDRYGSVLIQTR